MRFKVKYHVLPLALCACLASSTVQADESLLINGKAAFEDGLHSLAQKNLNSFIRVSTNQTVKGEAVLYLARSLYAEEKLAEVRKLFNQYWALSQINGNAGSYVYWSARVLLDQGADEEVLQLLTGSTDIPEDDEYYPLVLRLKARVLVKIGRVEDAMGVFKQVDDVVSDQEGTAENLLDWASLLIQADRAEEARVLLVRLSALDPKMEAVNTGRLLLAKLQLQAGSPDEALKVLDLVTSSTNNVSHSTLAAGWFTLAEVYEKGGELTKSLAALEKYTEQLSDRAEIARARLLQARLLIRSGELELGAALLRTEISTAGIEPTAANSQLFLADALAGEGFHEEAELAYQNYLEAFTDETGTARALLGKAWSLYEQERFAEAVTQFEKAAAAKVTPAQKKEALYKVADSYFANEQFEPARKKYLEYARLFPGDIQQPESLFQAATCLKQLEDFKGALREFQRLTALYPESACAEKSMLEVAFVRLAEQDPETAIADFEKYLQQYPEGLHRVDTLLERGLAQYRIGLFKQALKSFEILITDFPDHPLAERAFFMRGWAHYMLGKDERALEICNEFIVRYPDSKWLGAVIFWVAEYHFNHGDFTAAEEKFAELADKVEQGSTQEKAIFWAGRAAYNQKEYLRAVEYFTKMIEGYPESDRVSDALFYQAEASAWLGRHAGAILIFDQVIKEYPQSYLLFPAWGRKGDCQFTLGQEDADRYSEALSSFQTIVDSPDADSPLQLQAEYKVARTFESMNDLDSALEQYMKVVYHFLSLRGEMTPESVVWFTRAGFQAAELLEKREEWREAIRVYQRVVEARIPASVQAEARINEIRVEKLILF